MARKAVSKTVGVSREAYDTDENLRLALTHLIQVIGEAARQVSREFSDTCPEIPWADIIGMRNKSSTTTSESTRTSSGRSPLRTCRGSWRRWNPSSRPTTISRSRACRALRLNQELVRKGDSRCLTQAEGLSRLTENPLTQPDQRSWCGAEGGTRTPTVLLPPAPQAGASANSATSAWSEVERIVVATSPVPGPVLPVARAQPEQVLPVLVPSSPGGMRGSSRRRGGRAALRAVRRAPTRVRAGP